MKTEKKYVVNININDFNKFNNLINKTSSQIIKIETLQNPLIFDDIFNDDSNGNELFTKTGIKLINQVFEGHNSGLIIYSLNRNLHNKSLFSNLFNKTKDFLLNSMNNNINFYISVLSISNNKVYFYY